MSSFCYCEQYAYICHLSVIVSSTLDTEPISKFLTFLVESRNQSMFVFLFVRNELLLHFLPSRSPGPWCLRISPKANRIQKTFASLRYRFVSISSALSMDPRSKFWLYVVTSRIYDSLVASYSIYKRICIVMPVHFYSKSEACCLPLQWIS